MDKGGRINAIITDLAWDSAECEIDENLIGATNTSYFCKYKNDKYIIRLGAENSDLLGIDRSAEKAAIEAVRDTSYCVPLIYFNTDNGDMVTKYVYANEITFEEFSQDENIIKMAEIMKDLHSRKTDYFFDPYEDVEKELCYIRESNIKMHEKFNEAYEIYKTRRDANPIFEPRYLRLCHNDITTGNCLITEDKKRIYLIDYEFSGMGNIFVDIMCCVHSFTPEKQQLFLKTYFGEYQEYMTRKIKDFHIIILMWNVMWAYLKSLAPGGSNVDYISHGNQWLDAIFQLNADQS